MPTHFVELRTALDGLAKVERVAQQLKELEPTNSAVNPWAHELPALVAQYQLFADRKVAGLRPEPNGEKVRAAVAVAREKVAASPRALTEGRTFTNLRSAVTKVIEAYEEVIKTAWSDWVQQQSPRIVDAELVPFAQNPDYRVLVEQIRRQLEVLRRAERDVAESAQDFQNLESLAAKARELLGKLPTDAPKEVKAFLAATNTREGAPLTLLTAEVLDWLRKNNQLDNYRIRR